MFALKAGYGWAVICLVVFCGVMLVYSRMVQRVPRGEWGGDHISMSVGDQSAKIEYDCAHGEIFGPLSIDGEGKFQWRGNFTPERGGPMRQGETARTRDATYAGTVAGTAMTLTLKIADSDDTETFTLEKDKPAKLMKCK